MKNIFSTLLLCLISILMVHAQQNGLMLSTIHPEPSMRLSAVYDPAMTMLAGKNGIEAKVFYWNNKNRCVPLTAVITDSAGKKKLNFTIPELSKALIFTFAGEGLTDNNSGKGYVFPLYNNNQPVKGAWADIASVYIYGNKLTHIAPNQTLAAAAMQTETNLYPISKTDFADNYYAILINSTIPSDKILLNNDLSRLSNSKQEADARQAILLYSNMKKQASSDSLKAIAIKRFPNGDLAAEDRLEKIYDESDADKKEILYNAWIRDFPAGANPDHLQYDYARYAVACAYAQSGKSQKAISFINLVETGIWQGTAYSGLASYLIKNNDLKNSELLLKRAIDTTRLYMTKRANMEDTDFAAEGYYQYITTYANVLYQEKKYSDALTNIREAYDHTAPVNGRLNQTYALHRV